MAFYIHPLSRAVSMFMGVGMKTVCIPLRSFAIQGMVMVDNRCAIAGTNIKMQLNRELASMSAQMSCASTRLVGPRVARTPRTTAN